MKAILLISTLLFGFFAYAGSTVCKGKSIKYSYLKIDFGTKPPPGTKTGSLEIKFNEKVLVKRSFYSNTGHFTVDPYSVELSKTEVISSTGNMINGSSLSKNLATLYQVNTFSPNDKKSIHKEEVICKKTWSMRP